MPPSQLFLEERRRWIMDRLSKLGRVAVNELSAEMNVSAVTIRQDLKALEAEGLLERTHGGAVSVLVKSSEERELSFDIRRKSQIEEKNAIGRVAASMVETGSAIALDASTTICSIIPYLTDLHSLTIVTNNLMVPELVLNNRNIEVFLSGGRLRRDSYSVIGNPRSLPEINLNIGFFSAWGITPEAGLTEVTEGEKVMKQALLARCKTRVLLLDSSKWGRVAPFTYGFPQEMDVILTTSRAPREILSQFEGVRIDVIPM
jgi:DeoR/GlpR family transcriptional regulator of sugar metabolism